MGPVVESDRDIVQRGLILRGTVGSTAHGLHLGGTDDRDEMGVAIEPPSRLIGLVPFEHHIYRTAEERAGHDPTADQRQRGRTPRSRPGDLDLVVYSLRKYVRLAANGNPTVQILLFVEPLHSTVWATVFAPRPTCSQAGRPAPASSGTCRRSGNGCSASAARCG